VVERMRELEQAILNNETEPDRLKRVARYIELAIRAIEPIMEAARNDPEMREKTDGATYLLVYLQYALLSQQGKNGQSVVPKDEPSIPLVEYRGKAINLIELASALLLTKDFYVDGRPMTRAFIAALIERIFGIPADKFDGKVQDMKKRKIGSAVFLQTLANSLSAYLGRLPDDRPRRKGI